MAGDRPKWLGCGHLPGQPSTHSPHAPVPRNLQPTTLTPRSSAFFRYSLCWAFSYTLYFVRALTPCKVVNILEEETAAQRC